MQNTRLGHVTFSSHSDLTCTYNMEARAFLPFTALLCKNLDFFVTIASCFCVLVANLPNKSTFNKCSLVIVRL